jgi:hypothetical protein
MRTRSKRLDSIAKRCTATSKSFPASAAIASVSSVMKFAATHWARDARTLRSPSSRSTRSMNARASATVSTSPAAAARRT